MDWWHSLSTHYNNTLMEIWLPKTYSSGQCQQHTRKRCFKLWSHSQHQPAVYAKRWTDWMANTRLMWSLQWQGLLISTTKLIFTWCSYRTGPNHMDIVSNKSNHWGCSLQSGGIKSVEVCDYSASVSAYSIPINNLAMDFDRLLHSRLSH